MGELSAFYKNNRAIAMKKKTSQTKNVIKRYYELDKHASILRQDVM